MKRGSDQERKIVVGITGASGAPYAKRLLQQLAPLAKEGTLRVACVLSQTAKEVWALECGGSPLDQGFPMFEGRDYSAPFASGSAGYSAMVVVPCSMGTASRIAHGVSDTLLTRTADVMLKERRTLILVPRESPLSTIHLENLLGLARAGALIVPASPAFYGKPKTLEDAIDTVIARVLDHLDLPHQLGFRWGTSPTGEAP